MNIEEKLKDLIIQATTERSHYYVRSVCEESLKEIDSLKKQLDEAVKVIEFYSNEHNWSRAFGKSGESITSINISDQDFIGINGDCRQGGKKAREFLKRMKNEN